MNNAVSSGLRALWAQRPQLAHPLTGYLLLVMIVGGVVLRLQNVGYPFRFGFDEHQYAVAAHQFMVGTNDVGECCHPPLSKLLIGIGMLLLGNNPVGWRYAPLCFGLQSIVLVYFIARSLFADRKAAWLAAAFMAADGFYLTYSRVSLPDGILASLTLWCMLAAITARGWAGVLTCAVLVGLAVSVKWVALLVGLPACVAILLLRRAPWYTIFAFAIVPFVHIGVWMLGLGLIGHPNDLMSVIAEIQHRQEIHLGFAHHTNPLESPWYSWLVMYHPIVIKSAHVGATVRLASSIGNPLLFAAADVCLVGLPIAGALAARSPTWRARWSRWFDARSTKALAILGASWLSMMLLWMSGRIVTYWYHYLTPWGFAILLVAGVVARLDRRFPKDVMLFVLLVLGVSIYLAPVWGELPISADSANHRLLMPLWR